MKKTERSTPLGVRYAEVIYLRQIVLIAETARLRRRMTGGVSVPELTRSSDIKLNERVALPTKLGALESWSADDFAMSVRTPAKPSGEYSPLGGLVPHKGRST